MDDELKPQSITEEQPDTTAPQISELHEGDQDSIVGGKGGSGDKGHGH